jgi:hypothetical protein
LTALTVNEEWLRTPSAGFQIHINQASRSGRAASRDFQHHGNVAAGCDVQLALAVVNNE